MDIEYEILCSQRLNTRDHASICDLLRQLSPELVLPSITRLAHLADMHQIFVARSSGMIVGTVMLITIPKYGGDMGWVDYLSVQDSYRGLGVGRGLMECVIREAGRARFIRLDLTARPVRAHARNLYEKLGFIKRDADVYRLPLKP